MSYENVLLIGGPKDGVRMSVIAGVPCIRLGILPNTPASIGSTALDVAEPYESVEYRRVPVQSHNGFEGCVYVFGDIDPMEALVDGYRKP